MFTKKIIFEASDGTVIVVTPSDAPRPGETEAEYYKRHKDHAIACDSSLKPEFRVLNNCNHVGEIEATELPTERRFRKSWKLVGGAIVEDPAIVDQIKRDTITAIVEKRIAKAQVAEAIDLQNKTAWTKYKDDLIALLTAPDPDDIVFPVRPDGKKGP